jgi:hypothetical protein
MDEEKQYFMSFFWGNVNFLAIKLLCPTSKRWHEKKKERRLLAMSHISSM